MDTIFTGFMFYLFIVMGMINVVHFGFFLIGANIYDIWQYLRARKQTPPQSADRPLVSVLIPAHNEGKSIIRCLESVYRNNYSNFEVLVIDDASSDNTSMLVSNYIRNLSARSDSYYLARQGRTGVFTRRFIRMRPSVSNTNFHLLSRQKNQGKGAALNYALLRGVAKGELIMTLDADSVLHPDAIKRAVSYFSNPSVAGVAANVRIMESLTPLGLLQKFEHMIGYRSKKFYTLSNSEFIIGGVASTYRSDVMQKVGYYDEDTQTEDIGLSLKIVSLGNRQNRVIYAADVVAMTEGVRTFKALLRQRYRWKMGSLQNLFKHRQLLANVNKKYSRALTFYRIPMAFWGEIMLLFEPIMLAYIFVLSMQAKNPAMFIGAYMTITLYLLWNIWPDEHTGLKSKLRLSAYAPIMYLLFYVMNLVQVIAIFKCLFNFKQMTLRDATPSSWISPERSGRRIELGTAS